MVATMHTLAATVAEGPGVQFSSIGMEVLSSVVHLVGVSLLSYMLAMKLSFSEMLSFHISNFSWPRLLVILNIIDAWAFLFTAGILVHGTGMELSPTICLLGILNCIVFYASSKILIYLFLVEKVYVVWAGRMTRWRCKVYIGCMAVVGVYMGVAIFLILGRVAYFREDGACVIGLIRPASLTLLIYDLLINVLLTGLFVWPLLDRQFSTALKGVAVRTLWAATAALTTSCVNILVLTLMHGQQLAWVCLASCGADVVINAGILCWVTASKYERDQHSHDPSNHNDKGFTSNIVLYSTATVCGPDSPFGRARGPGEEMPRSPGMRGRISRMLDTGANAPPSDIELSSVSADLDSKSGFREELKRTPAREGGPFAPLIRTPFRAHTSTMKRSNTALMRHPTTPNDELQIIVTRETDVVMDDIPSPVAKSPAHRASGSGSESESETSL